MAMADGRNRLHKIAFRIGSRFFRFAINPENYVHARPHRTTAIKTKSRIVLEDFQSDIETITIKGTTGFNPTGRRQDRGINKIMEMKRYLERYAEAGGNGSPSPNEFYFHNFTNGEHFIVHLAPEGVSYTQDVSSPLTFDYEISFIVLRKAGEPSDDEVIQPELGNRFPSLPRGVGMPSLYPIPPISSITPSRRGGTGSGGEASQSDVYNRGTSGTYVDRVDRTPVNPQVPSRTSYELGRTGLGHSIGYYGRDA